MPRKREEMAAQVVDWDPTPDRNAVSEDVQGRRLDVDDAMSVDVSNPGLTQVPFLWDNPVVHSCPRRDFNDPEWHVPGHSAKGFAYSVTCETATNGVELFDQLVHLRPCRFGRRHDVSGGARHQGFRRCGMPLWSGSGAVRGRVSDSRSLPRKESVSSTPSLEDA